MDLAAGGDRRRYILVSSSGNKKLEHNISMWIRKSIGGLSGEKEYRKRVHSRELGGRNWVKFVHVVVE